jgi:hypothetical protein
MALGMKTTTTTMKRRRTRSEIEPPYSQQQETSGNSSMNRENSRGSCRGVDEITIHSSDDESVERAGETPRRGMRVTVICGEETICVNLSSGTLFHVFDDWVRSRFALSHEISGVRYLNESSEEFIPDFSCPAEQNLTVRVQPTNLIRPRSHSSVPEMETKTESLKKTSTGVWSHLRLLSFSAVFPLTAFLYLAIFLIPNSPIPNPMRSFRLFSPILTLLGVETEAQLSLYRELVCTFIAWPVPYFFIRRSLNPDFGFALSVKKFGFDSFWGALAACVLVLLRYFVKAHLSLVAAEAEVEP